MPLQPHSRSPSGDESAQVRLTGVDVRGTRRDLLLRALRHNRSLLHEPQPGAVVDESAVQATVDRLLDRLPSTPSSDPPPAARA